MWSKSIHYVSIFKIIYSETWKNAKKIIQSDLIKESSLYQRRLAEITPFEKDLSDYQILTSSTDYSLILQGKKDITDVEKWKMIFHTDQSLFQ